LHCSCKAKYQLHLNYFILACAQRVHLSFSISLIYFSLTFVWLHCLGRSRISGHKWMLPSMVCGNQVLGVDHPTLIKSPLLVVPAFRIFEKFEKYSDMSSRRRVSLLAPFVAIGVAIGVAVWANQVLAQSLLHPNPGVFSRFNRLIAGDFIGPAPQGLTFREAWAKFEEKVPAWRDKSSSYIFWDDHAHIEGLQVIRIQNSGLCYIHAPVVLQHYLVSINSGGTNHEMIDISKFVRATFGFSSIFNDIVFDHGGYSLQILHTISGHGDDLRTTSPLTLFEPSWPAHQVAVDTIVHQLRSRKAPALVSNFMVLPSFGTLEVPSYTEFHGHSENLHAMVLVGYRTDPVTGQVFFLLQNWWKSMPFVEVSSAYFASAGAAITFVNSQLTSIPTKFPTIVSSYAETNADFPERMPEERKIYQ
jgi:hypothetical protein